MDHAETQRPWRTAPEPVLALDVPDAASAFALLERAGPAADFVKVGLQLFVAEGPLIVRELRERGKRVFLDLKLHDIPNTVAHAVKSAARLDVQLLTVHAGGGAAMLRAAAEAAGGTGVALLGVTVLTSLDDAALAEAWGREAVHTGDEVARLAGLAARCGIPGVVASVHEIAAIRRATGDRLKVLTPGIRRAGDAAGDQARVATPAQAARLGSDYVVLGRSVTAAADPSAALAAAIAEMQDLTD